MRASSTIGFALVVCALVGTAPPPKAPQVFPVKLDRVEDGDTVWVRVKLRLANIDTPEFAHASFGRVWGEQPFAREAKEALEKKLAAGDVAIRIVGYDGKDKRPVAEIFSGTTNLNRWLVRQGYAWEYTSFSHDAALAELQAEAKRNGRGLWGAKHPIEPEEWRRGSHHQGEAK